MKDIYICTLINKISSDTDTNICYITSLDDISYVIAYIEDKYNIKLSSEPTIFYHGNCFIYSENDNKGILQLIIKRVKYLSNIIV